MLAPPVTVQNLQAARNLIVDEARWHQGSLCRFADGRTTDVAWEMAGAVAYCAIGAMYKVGQSDAVLGHLNTAAIELFGLDPKKLGLYPAAHVNDHLSHDAVMRMFDRAIELALASTGERT